MNTLESEILSYSSYSQNIKEHITETDVNCSYYGNYADYISDEYVYIGGEIALWRAVLLQSFIDLKSKSKKKRNQPFKKEAYNWFTKKENENDVREVCSYADYDYRTIKTIADEIIAENFSR